MEVIAGVVGGIIGLIGLLWAGSASPRVGDLIEAEGYPVNSHMLPGPDLDGDGKFNDLHWAEVPIGVIYSPSFRPWLGAWAQATAKAGGIFSTPVEATEREISVEGLVRPNRGIVYLTTDSEGFDPEHGTSTIYRFPDGEIYSVLVVMPQECRAELMGAVALHEMMHTLGFAHSDNRSDIMYPTSSGVKELNMGQLRIVRSIANDQSTVVNRGPVIPL